MYRTPTDNTASDKISTPLPSFYICMLTVVSNLGGSEGSGMWLGLKVVGKVLFSGDESCVLVFLDVDCMVCQCSVSSCMHTAIPGMYALEDSPRRRPLHHVPSLSTMARPFVSSPPRPPSWTSSIFPRHPTLMVSKRYGSSPVQLVVVEKISSSIRVCLRMNPSQVLKRSII